MISRESKLKRKEQQEKSDQEPTKIPTCLPPDSKETEQNMDLDLPIKTKNDDAKIIELDKLKIDDETRNSNVDLNCKNNEIIPDDSPKIKFDDETVNDNVSKNRGNIKESTSKLSRTDS